MGRVVTCWAPGCDATLAWVDGRWRCPAGHPLRDASRWVRDHIDVMQGEPALLRRIFDPDMP